MLKFDSDCSLGWSEQLIGRSDRALKCTGTFLELAESNAREALLRCAADRVKISRYQQAVHCMEICKFQSCNFLSLLSRLFFKHIMKIYCSIV